MFSNATLWFPEHVPRETVLVSTCRGFQRDSFQQIVPDRVDSRFDILQFYSNHVCKGERCAVENVRLLTKFSPHGTLSDGSPKYKSL